MNSGNSSAVATSDRSRLRTLAFYSGVFLTSGGVLMLQILETRILSVTSWYYLAFFVISMAMFGLTAGAVRVWQTGSALSPQQAAERLPRAASHFSAAVALSLMLQFCLADVLTGSLTTVVALSLRAVILAVPFFFAGLVLCLALTRTDHPVARVYGVDLVGAGAGCLGALGLLSVTDAPSAVLWVAVVTSVGAIAFVAGLPGAVRLPLYRQLGWTALLGVLALFNSVSDLRFRPLLVKGQVESRADIRFSAWNSLSRVIAHKPYTGPPYLWGASLPDPSQLNVEQMFLNIDGDAGTPMYRYRGGDPRQALFLAYDVTNVAHALAGRESAAIIGVGGGRDILAAALFGKKPITGIEVNPIFIRLLTAEPEFASFAGIRSLDHVTLIADEARSWLARTEQRFDFIQMSLTDTWAATGAGAFTLSENGLYTRQAWTLFLRRLNPGGVLTVSRWYHREHDYETGRLLSLAVAALLDAGVSEPRRHLFVATNNNPAKANSIATLILSGTALAPGDLADLEKFVELRGHSVLVSPTVLPASELLASIVTARSANELEMATGGRSLEFRPPTDDWPFFFNHLRLDRPGEIVRRLPLFHEYGPNTVIGGVILGNIAALITLLLILVISAVLVGVSIVVPLRRSVQDSGRALVAAGTGYFLLLGLGFMVVEIALLQRASVVLGHPAYALGVVLCGLICATGCGSLIAGRMPLDSRRACLAWSVLTAACIAGLAVVLPGLQARFQDQALAGRGALIIAVLVPPGLLMGFGLPTGMRLVGAIDPRPTPWFFGVNGAASVLAGGLGVLGGLTLGLAWTLLLGALCYLLLAPCLVVLVRLRGARPGEL